MPDSEHHEDEDFNDDDIDQEDSVFYKDHEISRQLGGPNNVSRNRHMAMLGTADDAMIARKNEYKALQT